MGPWAYSRKGGMDIYPCGLYRVFNGEAIGRPSGEVREYRPGYTVATVIPVYMLSTALGARVT